MRGFEAVVDEPAEYGGADTGPMPTELFLASLASCFALATAHAGRKRGVELPDLTVRVHGKYEGTRFSTIQVEIQSSHPRQELESFVQRAVTYCYVSNTLRRGPALEYVVVEGPISHAPPPPRD
jgi:uncharacterized OsmC-like protein